MKQDAILFSRSNAEQIATQLNEAWTAEELLQEYEWMLNRHHILVLARDVLPTNFAMLSYVVTLEMFASNNPNILLNPHTFTHVRDV